MYRYNENYHREAQVDRRLRAFFIVVVVFVLLVGVLAYFYIRSDIGGQTLGSQGSARVIEDEAKTYFETEHYSFEAPQFWVEQEVEESIYEHYSYYSTALGEEARTLDIFVDEMPRNLAANRAVKVKTTRTEIQPLSRSPQCITLQEEGVSDFKRWITWEEVEFYCEPNRDRHALVAASVDDGMGLSFGSGQEEFKLFFVYTDHTGKEDYTIFDDILESVEVLR